MLKYGIIKFRVIIKEKYTKDPTFSLSTPKMKEWRLLGKFESIKYEITGKKKLGKNLAQ